MREDDNKYIVGPWLKFDPEKERHTGEYAETANALLRKESRSGFRVPDPDKV